MSNVIGAKTGGRSAAAIPERAGQPYCKRRERVAVQHAPRHRSLVTTRRPADFPRHSPPRAPPPPKVRNAAPARVLNRRRHRRAWPGVFATGFVITAPRMSQWCRAHAVTPLGFARATMPAPGQARGERCACACRSRAPPERGCDAHFLFF